MTDTPVTLHMLCGKIASGKSTLATRLADTPDKVLLSEDAWLSALFPDQMRTPGDYVRCAAKLRDVLGPHVTAVLKAGVSVVLDFPANTVETRDWARALMADTGADHMLHVVNTPESVCLERLAARKTRGEHYFAPTEAQFHMFSKHFTLPSEEEGFKVTYHDQTA